MAYSRVKYQLTHLLQDAWYRMGQLTTWVATGGSATTLINTAWAGVEEQIFDDDDPELIYGSVVVVEDAGGAGADPEGRIGRITDYDSSAQTITMDTVTTAIAANDRVAIATPIFPYEDMRQLANIALRKLGKIDVVDLSIVAAAGQTQYTLPIQSKPKRIRVLTLSDSDNRMPETINNWDVLPAAPGTPWTLVVPEVTQGLTIEVLYEGLHPELTAYDSDISEVIAPEVALNALLAEAYQWYNNKVNGSNAYYLQRENKALQDLEQSKVNFPINRLDEQVQGMPHWGTRTKYVHGTSDARY